MSVNVGRVSIASVGELNNPKRRGFRGLLWRVKESFGEPFQVEKLLRMFDPALHALVAGWVFGEAALGVVSSREQR